MRSEPDPNDAPVGLCFLLGVSCAVFAWGSGAPLGNIAIVGLVWLAGAVLIHVVSREGRPRYRRRRRPGVDAVALLAAISGGFVAWVTGAGTARAVGLGLALWTMLLAIIEDTRLAP